MNTSLDVFAYSGRKDRARETRDKPRVIIVGSGIAGLSSAWHLRNDADVLVLESEGRLGGHTHTRTISLDGIQCPVDTGFIVFNHRTYPELKRWFETLKVDTTPTDMSFSVSADKGRFEWSGRDLRSVFAQPSNALRKSFWRMLSEIIRFNKQAPQICESIEKGLEPPVALGRFLESHQYSDLFQKAYLLPMAGAIWSCPPETMRMYPFASFTRFCMNHGLLQLKDRPKWYSVTHGSRDYISRLLALLKKDGSPVSFLVDHAVEETLLNVNDHFKEVVVHGVNKLQASKFSLSADAVILACHADQALKVIHAQTSPGIKKSLSAVRFQSNIAYLHTDLRLMPLRRRAWAAWNYMSYAPLEAQAFHSPISVSYWMNRLQPLKFKRPVIVSLNPAITPDEDKTIEVNHYTHPIFDDAAVKAQGLLRQQNGEGQHWMAGAWMGYGFHEDGFRSGRLAAESILSSWATKKHQGISSQPWAA